MKLSPGKVNLAGNKQVFRRTDPHGRFLEDIIGSRDETVVDARPLLELVIQDGKFLRRHPSLEEIRERFREDFAALDEEYKDLENPPVYPVKVSARLNALQETASG
jgi:nicotinate phosphoribosyltransferase